MEYEGREAVGSRREGIGNLRGGMVEEEEALVMGAPCLMHQICCLVQQLVVNRLGPENRRLDVDGGQSVEWLGQPGTGSLRDIRWAGDAPSDCLGESAHRQQHQQHDHHTDYQEPSHAVSMVATRQR